jgi:hypothetical protein
VLGKQALSHGVYVSIRGDIDVIGHCVVFRSREFYLKGKSPVQNGLPKKNIDGVGYGDAEAPENIIGSLLDFAVCPDLYRSSAHL